MTNSRTYPEQTPPETTPSETPIRLKSSMRLLLTILSATLASALILPLWGQNLERALSDSFFQLRGPLPPPAEIALIGIDDESFQTLGLQWPWPRRLHARLIRALTDAKARVIVFDVLFDLPSHDPEDDRLFREAIASHPNVILATARAVKETESFATETWLIPSATLGVAEEATGGMELPTDSDGVVRRAKMHIGGRPSLSFTAANAFVGGNRDARATAIPGDEMVINFIGPGAAIRTVSYYQALEPQTFLPNDLLRDKLVFIGATTTVTSDPTRPDHFSTPFSTWGERTPGVEIHANAAHDLLYGSYLTQLPTGIAWPAGFATALLSGLLLFRGRPLLAGVALLGVAATALLFAYFLFAGASYLVPIAHLIVPTATVYLTSLFTHYYETSQSEKRNRLLLERSERRIRDILAGIGAGIGEVRPPEGSPTRRVVKVFVSYHHKAEDASTMSEILAFLEGLRDEYIEFWTDRQIQAGELWDQEVREKLGHTDIALALISQGYLDSPYVKRVELPSFLERSITIIPIMLSPCEWERHAWLKQRQILPGGGRTIAEHYMDLAERQRLFLQIKDAIRESANRIRRID